MGSWSSFQPRIILNCMFSNIKNILLIFTALLTACASNPKQSPEEISRLDKQNQDIESLRRSLETSFYREKELEQRLDIAEKRSRVIEKQLTQVLEDLRGVDSRLDSLKSYSSGENQAIAAKLPLLERYQMGLANYKNKKYLEAQDIFEEVMLIAPKGVWADNAQYWKGECLYGLGDYRRALIEFRKILAFSNTEKADDAQLKIARCLLQLQEKDKAISAFKKLLNEFPESEYLARARKELKYLGE